MSSRYSLFLLAFLVSCVRASRPVAPCVSIALLTQPKDLLLDATAQDPLPPGVFALTPEMRPPERSVGLPPVIPPALWTVIKTHQAVFATCIVHADGRISNIVVGTLQPTLRRLI